MSGNNPSTGRFKPGQSGNPSGRPKVPAEVREAIRAACPEAVQTLIAIMRDVKEKTAYRLDAARTLLDRGYGKPETMSRVELTGSENGAIVFRWMNGENRSNEEASQ